MLARRSLARRSLAVLAALAFASLACAPEETTATGKKNNEAASGATSGAGPSGTGGSTGSGPTDPLPALALRVAQFNLREMSTAKIVAASDAQVTAAAEVIARFAPDIVSINELQYDMVNVPTSGLPGAPYAKAGGFQGGAENAVRLAAHVTKAAADVTYPHTLITRGNSGYYWEGDDLGQSSYVLRGWGEWPGRFNTAVLSRYPILENEVRVIHDIPWKSLPETSIDKMKQAEGIDVPDGFPIFEKSLNIVPVDLGDRVLYLVLLHTVSPAFDPINPYRNFDELRALRLFLDGALPGVEPLSADARFVILGDLNADPDDGDGLAGAIEQLVNHPSVVAWYPAGHGTKGANGQLNTYVSGCGKDDGTTVTDPTKKFQMQLDYILPGKTIGQPKAGEVFWPDHVASPEDWALRCTASDHALLYADLELH
jgi:hypothetical protein